MTCDYCDVGPESANRDLLYVTLYLLKGPEEKLLESYLGDF